MDEVVTIILIVGILGIAGIFVFYILKTYVMPKKLDELAAMIEMGQAVIALKRLQAIVEEDDHNPYAHFLLAEAYAKTGHIQEAIMEYKQAMKYAMNDPRTKEELIRSRLAALYLTTRNYNEAKKEYLILTKLAPNDPENFYQVGRLFENAGLSEKALPYFLQAVKINPSHEDAQFHVGVINYNHKNIRDAKSALSEAVKINPKHFGAHYYLGQCLRNQKDLDWSIREFDAAARDDGWKARALLGKALCLFEKQAYRKAIEELEMAEEYSENSIELRLNIQYQIAACAEKIRDFNTAIAKWEKIMEVNPRFRDVAEKLQNYEEYRTHDSIKDFMIASPAKFERICRDIVEREGYHITELNVVSDSEVNITATDTTESTTWRSAKKPTTIFVIYRSTEPVPEKELRLLHEKMRQTSITRATCLTTSEYTTQAELFAQSRPIELYGKKEFIGKLRGLI